jgi:hypothetical protein
MNGVESFYGFYLHDDRILHDEIGPMLRDQVCGPCQ